MDQNNYNSFRDGFLAACQNGDYATMNDISVRCCGHVDFRCPKTGENGLHKCIRSTEQDSSLKIAQYILEKESTQTMSVSNGNYTPLILATHFQNERMIRTLARNTIEIRKLMDWTTDKEIVIDDNVSYVPFSTALHIAVLSGNINIIKCLLSERASFWLADDDGETALELAQKSKHSREIMPLFCDTKDENAHDLIQRGKRDAKTIALLDIFLENGVDVNCKDEDGYSLLYIAIERCDLSTAQFLVSRGAHINAIEWPTWVRTGYDRLILHFAAKTENSDMMACLLDVGADVNLNVGYGGTVLNRLSTCRGKNIKNALECCELLLQHGARVNVPSAAGRTPLINVLYNVSKVALAIYIISAGSDSSYFRNPTSSQVQFARSFKHVSQQPKLFYEFLIESGFPMSIFIQTLQVTNSELATYIETIQQTPRSLKRLAANVIRRVMVPNAWSGLHKLPLPPGFDKQYIIMSPKHVASEWLQMRDGK